MMNFFFKILIFRINTHVSNLVRLYISRVLVGRKNQILKRFFEYVSSGLQFFSIILNKINFYMKYEQENYNHDMQLQAKDKNDNNFKLLQR